MTKLDFSYLVSPFNATDFFAQYWQKSALVIKRDEADRYRELIDATDASDVLAMASELPADAVEVIGKIRTRETTGDKSGKNSNAASGEVSDEAAGEAANALADWFRKGATIRVKAVERFCQPLGEFCKNLEDELSFPVRANLYCTPGNSRGFDLHFDTHEVFVLQLFGKKRWQIFEPTVRLPLEFAPPLPFENDREALSRAHGRSGSKRDVRDDIAADELGAPALEALLEPGDCLYLPRGFVHQAAAEDEPSVHLTIGVHVLTWLDLLSVALGQTARRNEDFRRALPVGIFNERTNVRQAGEQASEVEKEFEALVKQFGSAANFAEAVSEMAESFARRQRVGSRNGSSRDEQNSHDRYDAVGKIESVDSVDAVAPETKLAGNGMLRFYLAADGTMAGVASDGKELWLPVGFATALRFVTEQNEFRADEIPGLVGNHGKLAFARQLLKDGFVRIAR
jgi:ribosomal protein L16 Arg81 hydroxylase